MVGRRRLPHHAAVVEHYDMQLNGNVPVTHYPRTDKQTSLWFKLTCKQHYTLRLLNSLNKSDAEAKLQCKICQALRQHDAGLTTKGLCSAWELALYKVMRNRFPQLQCAPEVVCIKSQDNSHDRITSWVRVDVLVLSPRLIIMADGEHHTGTAGRAGRECPNAAWGTYIQERIDSQYNHAALAQAQCMLRLHHRDLEDEERAYAEIKLALHHALNGKAFVKHSAAYQLNDSYPL